MSPSSLLLTDEDGNEYVPKNIGVIQFELQWLTQWLLTEQNLHQNIPITHAYLRFLSHFQEVLYRQKANVFIMGRGDPEKQRIMAAKLQIQKEVQFGPIAMKFDVPYKYGHIGNSEETPSPKKLRSKNVSLLLQNISVILRVISSKEENWNSQIWRALHRNLWIRCI